MVRYNTVLGTDTKPKFQQKKSKVKVMYFSDGALPQPVILPYGSLLLGFYP